MMKKKKTNGHLIEFNFTYLLLCLYRRMNRYLISDFLGVGTFTDQPFHKRDIINFCFMAHILNEPEMSLDFYFFCVYFSSTNHFLLTERCRESNVRTGVDVSCWPLQWNYADTVTYSETRHKPWTRTTARLRCIGAFYVFAHGHTKIARTASISASTVMSRKWGAGHRLPSRLGR